MPIIAAESTQAVSIALGIVLRDSRVLIGWRDDKLPQGRCWEFPGGKVLATETPRQAVVRELKEETGLAVQEKHIRPLIEFRWCYDECRYFFSVYIVEDCRDEPDTHFYKDLKWQAISELKATDFPPANEVIIKALSLPPCYLISPMHADIAVIRQGLNAAFQSNISLAVFRNTKLDDDAYIDNARLLLSQNPTFNNKLLLHNHPAQVAALNAAGVQLSAECAKKYRARPLSKEVLLAVSCHNQAELEHACCLEADFALLGPVKATPSHPNSRGLGWDAFRMLVKNIPLPVYAVGGLGIADLQNSQAHGAQGIAAIRSLWPL